MSTKSPSTTQREGHMTPGVGYLFFNEINPIWPEAKSDRGILLPSGTAQGCNDGSQATWGRVVAVGRNSNRATCEPFSDDSMRRVTPLEPGSWIMLRKANNWTMRNGLKVLQTHDVVASFPAKWTWDQVVAEVMSLEAAFKD